MHLADSLHLTMEGVCAGKELAAVSVQDRRLFFKSTLSEREEKPFLRAG